jgi:gentisate 1,2-dioxygenase
MAISTKITEKDTQQFELDVRAAGMDAPWFHPGPLIQPKKLQVQSGVWKWDKIEPLVRSTPDFVDPGKGAERRILRIANPGVAELTATHTISIAFQYLMPGEVAPAHRHTPNAMRFMIDGEGAYTTVNGDKCMMHPGDVILTPAGDWHDHGNEGHGPVMWMDILDSPVVRFLEGLKTDPYPQEKQAPSARNERSERLYFSPGLVPAHDGGAGKATEQLLAFRWKKAREALDRLAEVESDPFDDVMLEYVQPRTGASVFPCIAAYLQMIRPGVETKAHRHSSSAVYFVREGSGMTEIGGANYEWSKGDVMVVAPSAVHRHRNNSREPAVLFTVQDSPMLKALGFYKEEAV